MNGVIISQTCLWVNMQEISRLFVLLGRFHRYLIFFLSMIICLRCLRRLIASAHFLAELLSDDVQILATEPRTYLYNRIINKIRRTIKTMSCNWMEITYIHNSATFVLR